MFIKNPDKVIKELRHGKLKKYWLKKPERASQDGSAITGVVPRHTTMDR